MSLGLDVIGASFFPAKSRWADGGNMLGRCGGLGVSFGEGFV